MQQGRVIVDDDWNENERIENEDRRRGLIDIIGANGSPDNGFRIDDAKPTPADPTALVDFDIKAGTYYLGGLRLELEETQNFRIQTDWLQGPHDAHVAPTEERFDLVYLETFQVPVEAVEDSELFEVALGGPDTSTRIRTIQRVRLFENVGNDDCAEAWTVVQNTWKANGLGTLNDENELIPDVSLTVTFDPGGTPNDLCTPRATGGYLGAENQAIRVQLVDRDHITWGFDNASPLYRVQLAADRKTVDVLTEPKDQAHWPLSGQIVEILPWSAVLPNGEKLAEIQGHLSRVEKSYNPDEGTSGLGQLTLQTPVVDALDAWQSRPDAEGLGASEPYYYMRVWDRGVDRTSVPAIPLSPLGSNISLPPPGLSLLTPIPSFTPPQIAAGGSITLGPPGLSLLTPAISLSPPASIALGHTGLQVTVSGPDRIPGDYWIIAARPETPNRVVPWDLETGRHPHGIRRFYAPLALIHWQFDGDNLVDVEIQDCRIPFRPLTLLQTCCSYTVGDGKTSHGHFDDLEEALAHLPRSGGQICLLPGLHEANIVIEGRRDIKIKGCGKRTRVIPKQSNQEGDIFQIVDAECITLEHMDLVTPGGTAISLKGTKPDILQEIEIKDIRILAYKHAIHVEHGVGINIHHNKIRMLDKEGGNVAVSVLAEDCLIEHNDIRVEPAGKPVPPEKRLDDVVFPDLTDPCAKLEIVFRNPRLLLYYSDLHFRPDSFIPRSPNLFHAPGGLQIKAGSERIKVLNNVIKGGGANGITLGGGKQLELPEEPGRLEPSVPYFDLTANTLIGNIKLKEGEPLPDCTLCIENLDDKTASPILALSREGGFVNAVAQPSRYKVSVLTPGYKVRKVANLSKDPRISDIQIEVDHDVGDQQAALSFLYDIQLEGNEISSMGQSGIGMLVQVVTTATARDPSTIAEPVEFRENPIVNLTIRRNHIVQCMQHPIVESIRAERRGQGGISLGYCANLSIHGNRIEDNGTSHINPVCGLYITHGEEIDITHNTIVNNGPLSSATDATLRPGRRGGIVVGFASSLDVLDFISDRRVAFAAGRPAARIHDNVVDQPAGQALSLIALGPVSVANNQFNSEVSGPGQFERIAGAVFITDPSGPVKTGSLDIREPVKVVGGSAQPVVEEPEMATSSNPVLANSGTERMLLASVPQRDLKAPFSSKQYPMTNILFTGNQTRYGARGNSSASQVIFTAGDLGVIGNLSEAYHENEKTVVNTFLKAVTVRTSENRFIENIDMEGPPKFSLISQGILLNNTTDNQANHCIVSIAPNIKKRDNQIINDRNCPDEENKHGPILVEPEEPSPIAVHRDTLEELRDTQVMMRSYQQHEIKRLENRLGAEHPRVQRLAKKLRHNLEIVRDLDVELEIANIKVPEIGKDDLLIHGRVIDENHRGIPDLTVYMEDNRGNALRFLGRSETDTSGYYALPVEASTVARLSGTASERAHLAVCTRKGDVVYRTPDPMMLTGGNQIVTEVPLGRTNLNPL